MTVQPSAYLVLPVSSSTKSVKPGNKSEITRTQASFYSSKLFILGFSKGFERPIYENCINDKRLKSMTWNIGVLSKYKVERAKIILLTTYMAM